MIMVFRCPGVREHRSKGWLMYDIFKRSGYRLKTDGNGGHMAPYMLNMEP